MVKPQSNYKEVPQHFLELNHSCEREREQIFQFFEEKVRPVLGDHDVIGIDSSKQSIYHLCNDYHMELSRETFELVKPLGMAANIPLDWDEIRPFLKFTFIEMPVGGALSPHITHHISSLSALLIPLRGKNTLSFYETSDEKVRGEKVADIEYFNPSYLNVNRFHASNNLGKTSRMLLKVHLTIVPWEKLISHTKSGDIYRCFDFKTPWTIPFEPGEKK